MTCPSDGSPMNRHAEKVTYAEVGDTGFDPAFGGIVEELHRCPTCGAGAASRADGESTVRR